MWHIYVTETQNIVPIIKMEWVESRVVVTILAHLANIKFVAPLFIYFSFKNVYKIVRICI